MNNGLNNNNGIILFAEDDDDDYMLSMDAFKELGIDRNVKRVVDGEDLLNYLQKYPPYDSVHQNPLPKIIFLDLNMPKIDGREALKLIKSSHRFKLIPTIILTTSNAPDDISESYKYGANSYIQKPDNLSKLTDMFRTIHDYWFEKVKLPGYSLS